MYRNLILAAIVSLSVFVTGCYDSIKFSSNQVDSVLNYDHKKIEIFINENDGKIGHYQIVNGACSVLNDSLFGRASKVSENGILSAAYLTVPLNQIKYFVVEDINTGRTALLTGGIIISTAVILGIAAASEREKSFGWGTSSSGRGTRFSCPLIYTLGDSGYKLESETFAGAVFKGIERTSYDVLKNLKPIDGIYKIKLVNAREETEYVNELKLIVVDHNPEISVIPDASGNIHTISKWNNALSVFDKNGNDITGILNIEDGQYFESILKAVDVQKDEDLIDYVTTSFIKPKDAKTVKIIVSGLNTELAYFALEKIFAFKGNKRIAWYNKLDSDLAEKSKFVGWLMREGMLHLEVWDGKTWAERGLIPDVGPGVAKTQITILKIADIKGDTLKVRASFRTGLWQLDRFAVDYSTDQEVEINEVSACYAANEKVVSISGLIAGSDSAYYITVNGEYANISFPVLPERPGLSRTLIAKTKGFYNQWALQSETAQQEVVDRILCEPLYGSKILIPLWLKENSCQDFSLIQN